MSVCKNCGYIGGYHKTWCPVPHLAGTYAPRVEITGNIVVHHPSKAVQS